MNDQRNEPIKKTKFHFYKVFWWQNDPIYRTFDDGYLVSQYLLLVELRVKKEGCRNESDKWRMQV